MNLVKFLVLAAALSVIVSGCVQDVDKAEFQFATPEQKAAADADADVASGASDADAAAAVDQTGDAEADQVVAPDADADAGPADVAAEVDAAADSTATCTAAQCDDGNPCTEDGCDLKSGACAAIVKADGTDCDDKSNCTTGDTCKAGTCAGKAVACNDGNPCTTDACLPASGCTTSANSGAACDDDNPCTQGDTCAGTACQAGKPTACPANEPCIAWKCDPVLGKCKAGYITDGTGCDDGNACTSGDGCGSGDCSGKVVNCDDSQPCTADACDAKLGCTHTANSQPCDDANPCTKGDLCAGSVCAGLPINATVDCDDGKVCTDDGCDPKGGCVHPNNVAPCTDGNACTDGDTCAGGSCTSGKNTCACQQDSDCAGFEDGDPCNGTLACDKAAAPFQCKVVAATVVVCATSGDGPCEVNACASATGKCGKVPANQGKGCDADGSVCTQSDTCAGGVCVAGAAVGCDDGAVCTDDSCDGKQGCKHVGNSKACDADGSVCTQGDTCSGGVCAPGAKLACADGNACTADSCDAKLGCQFVAVTDGAACDDGNGCTLGDKCAAGKCSGAGKSCDDGNACTADSCANNVCSNANTTLACDDGNNCTQADGCDGKGVCAGKAVVCDDGNPCTDDACVKGQGCVKGNNTAGCDDGQVCTVGDVCAGGACKAGPVKDCDDKNGCTSDLCAFGQGCVSLANSSTCSDGSACTVGDACGGGVCLAGAVTVCDDGNACTSDSCDGVNGCSNSANSAMCADDNACTADDACKEKACVAGKAVICDDGNGCTFDLCDIAIGCKHVPETGASCDDGNACTVADNCAAAGCVGSPALWTAAIKSGAPTAGAAAADGSALFVLNGYGNVARYARVSNIGSVVERVFDPSATQKFYAVAALQSGDFVVAGHVLTTNAGIDAWIARVDAKADMAWSAKFGTQGYHDYAFAVTPTDAGYLAVGQLGNSAGVFLADENGQTSAVPVGKYGARLTSVVIGKNGDTIAAGSPDGLQSQFWLVRLTKSLKVVFDVFGNECPGNTEFSFVTEIADGDLLLVCAGYSGSAPGMVRFSGAGSKKYAWKLPFPGSYSYASGAAVLSDGTVAVLGYRTKWQTNGFFPWLALVSANGGLVAVNEDVPGTQAGALAALPSDLLIVGASYYSPNVDATGAAVRTDRWGNSNCGMCTTKPIAACSDGLPCTADYCIGGQCAHAQLPQLVGCGDGKYCSEEKCK